MTSLKITINYNNSSEMEFEFRGDYISNEWVFFINKNESPYTIKMYEDNDMTYYDLCKNNEPIKMFQFEMGAFGYHKNLFEVINYIMRLS